MSTNLLVVDDHQVIIDGIKSIIPENKFKIMAEANDVAGALQCLDLFEIDCMVTDIQLPGRSGVELIREVKKRQPAIKCAVLSMFDEKAMVHEAMDAGADAYIIKSSDPSQLEKALEKILSGEKYICEDLSMLLLQNESIFNAKARHLLSPREHEVLKLVVSEKSNKQIAAELFISERTVESHRKNIYRKTNTESLVGLVRYALDNKLV